MKIEKLGLNKIKVTVSPRDLMSWDISFESLSPDSPRLREFIMSMIRQAEFETGFDAFGGNIMIEAMPQNNAFVFFITKVSSNMTESTKQVLRRKLHNKEFRVVKKAVSPKKNLPCIYCFSSFEDFLSFFYTANSPKDFMGAELYRVNSLYYLKLPVITTAQKRLALLAEEFAVKNETKFLESYLMEHGVLIARNEDFENIYKSFK